MSVAADERVCPHCGELPGGVHRGEEGSGCLGAAVGERPVVRDGRQLPLRPGREPFDGREVAPARGAEDAAGNPGTTKTLIAGSGWRRRHLEGWVVRAVDRDENLPPQRYESGLVLSLDGAFHVLDNQARGYGTRDFPAWEHTVSSDPVAMPTEARLIADLAAVLAANGLEPEPGPHNA